MQDCNVSRASGGVNRPNRGRAAKRSGCVDIAILQSAHDKEGVRDFVAEYGQVIVDECHHLSAFTFEQVMRQVKAEIVVGLTATPERKDGLIPSSICSAARSDSSSAPAQ